MYEPKLARSKRAISHTKMNASTRILPIYPPTHHDRKNPKASENTINAKVSKPQ